MGYQQPLPAPDDYQGDNKGSTGEIDNQQTKATATTPKSILNPNATEVASTGAITSQQEKEQFTKIKPAAGKKWNAERNAGVDPFVINRPARDGRFYPSPYKSFSPFTGNPSPRHFPFPSGPRPYYPGQGQNRGRGRIWGQNTGNRSMGEGARNIQKK